MRPGILYLRKRVLFLAIGLLLAGALTDHVLPSQAQGDRKFTFDVAEDCFDFVRNAVDPNENPLDLAIGDTVIVGGPIYPGGTLKAGVQNNLPTDPGSIGRWKSRAVMLANFDHVTNSFNGSPIAFATMLYMFPDDSKSLISEGLVPDFGLSSKRGVIGGTGSYSSAGGEVLLENIGVNGTGCFNYRFTFKLKD